MTALAARVARRPPLPARPRVPGRAGLPVAAAVLALACASPSIAWAASAQPNPTSILDVPGGAAGLAQALGIAPGASCARTLLTAIRVMWQAPPLEDRAAARRLRDARAYLEAVAAFERARSAFAGAAASLRTADDPPRRVALHALADALGGTIAGGAGARQLTLAQDAASVARRTWLTAAGLDCGDLVTRLNAGEEAPLALRPGVAPLPFGEDFWHRVLRPAAPLRGSSFASILGDRRAALLYYGAVALDARTQAFVAAAPALGDVLYSDLASAVLALNGRSLHVDNGRVAVPGGADAEPLWEAVVGAPVSDAVAFTAWLLSRDDGRIALLYDAIAHLEPSARRFALGFDEPDPARRRQRFVGLTRAAAAALAGWSPRDRPFERVVFDVAHLLIRTRMAPGGRPLGPVSRRFWTAAFEGADLPPPERYQALDGGPVLDAADLAGLVVVANTAARRDRAEAWLFAQRVFPSPAPGDLADALVAVRALARYKALILTLERMGITDAATYALAARTADALSRIDRGAAWTPLALFQGALAIVERARFSRVMDGMAADRLVRSLCALPVERGEYLGGVAAWIDRHLLDAWGAPGSPGPPLDARRPVESRVLAAMAGAVESSPYGRPAEMPEIEWEGLRYRVDPASASFRRLVAIRERQGGQSLDAVLDLARAAAAVVTAEPDGLAQRTDELASAIETVRLGEPPRAAGRPDLGAALRDVRGRLGGAAGSERRARAVRRAQRAADWHLARVLAALAYAPHLGDADSPALLGGDPSSSHDFSLTEPRLDVRVAAMWSLPEEQRDSRVGWRVGGSLLGLDLAMSRFALRRLPSEVMPGAPMLSDLERLALTEPVVLASPFDHTDAARDALAAALRRGRERASRAAASRAALERLAEEAGLDEWRVALLPWLRDHDAERLTDEWSLGEFVRVGVSGPAAEFDPWGVSGASADGHLTVTFPWRLPWTSLAGRKGSRVVPALVPDLPIAVAEALADRGLPARLTVGVLSVATQELLDSLRVSHGDDWLALSALARAVMAGRLDDYVAALTIGGALVPVDMEPDHATDR